MRRRGFICLCGQLAAGGAWASEAGFGYGGSEGPSAWGGACAAGVNQSPVNLGGVLRAALPPLDIRYATGGCEVVNTGHAIQVNVGPGSTLQADGKTFALAQFHFHAPGEHRVEGREFPLEVHLVHRSEAGELAVIGVLFEVGEPSGLLQLVTETLPAGRSQPGVIRGEVSAAGLLPADRGYYRYNGSLTTPPCTEGVRWFVMERRLTASHEQIAAIAGALGFANNRPPMPVNARILLH